MNDSVVTKILKQDFSVDRLGKASLESPLSNINFIDDSSSGISYFSDVSVIENILRGKHRLPSFVEAGPRKRVFHDPVWSRAAIVTCGGLCPGLNDVIKALVNTLYYQYGVHDIYGIRYGYRGLVSKFGHKPMELNPDVVDMLHEHGGTVIGSSRGQQDTDEIINTLTRRKINMLFTVGGDGTQRGARDLVAAIKKRKLPISIIGLPKTIDNDLNYMDRTFGFETAIYASGPVINSAHDEAKGAYNGIGLVKLMGRDSGYIAAGSALANSVANFCLVPEVAFELDGENGFLAALARRLERKNHAVIIVAEGAGQHLFKNLLGECDASGNVLNQDIGLFLKKRIKRYMTERKIAHAIKYFDPSYLIRSVPAHGTDAIFCLHLAQNAVHVAMAGITNVVIGHWQGRFTCVPIDLAVQERRKIDPHGQLWQSVLNVTRQEDYFNNR